jgi:hypothetical protein
VARKVFSFAASFLRAEKQQRPAPPPRAPSQPSTSVTYDVLQDLFGSAVEVDASNPREPPPGQSELYDFLHRNYAVSVRGSSNVASIRWDGKYRRLTIRFLDARKGFTEHVYSGPAVTAVLAEQLYRAASKGTSVWDVLRVRGVGNKHRHQPGVSHRQVR